MIPLSADFRLYSQEQEGRQTSDIRLSEASFLPIDIYRQMSHWRCSPRFFASLRMTCSAGRQKRNVDYKTHRSQRRRYHNPRSHGPSILRTLRPRGRSILRTFPFEPARRRRAILPFLFHHPCIIIKSSISQENGQRSLRRCFAAGFLAELLYFSGFKEAFYVQFSSTPCQG